MDTRARDMGSNKDHLYLPHNNNDSDSSFRLQNKRAVAIPAPPPVEPTKPKPKPPATTPAKPKPTVAPPVVTTTTITTPPPVVEPTTTTTTTNTIEPTTTVMPGNSNADPSPVTSGPGTGVIIGIVAGIAVVLALIAGLVVRNRRRKRRGEEVHKAELYQQQRMMDDNRSSVLFNGRVPHNHRFSSSGLGAASAAATATGAGSRNGGGVGVGKRGKGGERGDRESLSEDYRQQQEQYYQQQPEWFAKKSPLEYYSQVPPIEQILRGVGRKESDNSLNGHMGGPGDKDDIELQHAGPSTTSSAPGQGASKIMAARSLQASTMQLNLQQHQQQQQQQHQQQQLQIQQQQNPFQAKQQQQQQQQYDRESIPLNPTDSNQAGRYNEPAKVIPRQQPTRQQQQQQQQQQREHSRAESTPPHSGHLPPIQLHSPMGSVYQDPAQTPTNSAYYHPVPPMPSRPNSFYNASNILSAALESSPSADYYAEVDMTSYYRPPPPVAPSTPSGFYDFDVGTDSNNNPLMSPSNGSSSYTEAAGVGGLPERPAGVANPPPIPRATRPVSLAPSPNNASNDNRAAILPTPYSPPPLPTISTTARSQDGYDAGTQSPVSPSSGPLVGGRTPRSIHGSGGRRA